MAKRTGKKLTNKVVLTEDQFNRAKDEESVIELEKYEKQKDGTYEIRLARIRAIQKAMKKSKRFILYTDQLGRRLYVGDNDQLKLTEEYPITFTKSVAKRFYCGFDNPELKTQYWDKLTGLTFKHRIV